MRQFILVLTLWLFWIILTSSISMQSLLVGLLVSGLTVFFVSERSEKKSKLTLNMLYIRRLLVFISNLLIEIVKANIDVAKIVLAPKLKIQPQFVHLPLVVSKESHQILLASAITLTPGTLTVDLDEKGYTIHALTDEAANSLASSSLVANVKALEEQQR